MIYIVTEPKLPEFIRRIDAAHHALSANEEILSKAIRENPTLKSPSAS
jgi:hypothetical protein